ncbi:MAG: PQQ-dependent sugar dehydrogenase [Candidatus Thorarchaeota archaeon]|jgi:glucose/arabinose dehydrogenase
MNNNWKGIIVVIALGTLILTVGLVATLPLGTPIPSESGLTLKNAFPSLSFTLPVDLQNANDGSDRLFLVEKSGVIQVFNNSHSATNSIVFLDITGLVSAQNSEMGLLGLAFHPDYKTNGYFFVDYTADSPRRTVIARYQVDTVDSNQANVSTATIILEADQPYTNHNGGQITFGPDGFLYIAMGDGGSGGDPLEHGQNRSTLLGSLLRIDIDNQSAGKNYSIPIDNPFAGNSMGYAEEIFAYGLRNPWRFSFDTETDNLWLADVGQNKIEEIDLIQNGGNYGWNLKEGNQCYAVSECDGLGLIDPIWEYNHGLGSSITGGFVYRGSRLPALHGAYLYGDYVSGRIWSLEYDGIGPTNNTELFDTTLSISSFGMDETGEVYVLSYDGIVYAFTSENMTRVSTTENGEETTPNSNPWTTTTTDTEPDSPVLIDLAPLQIVSASGLIVVIVIFAVRYSR